MVFIDSFDERLENSLLNCNGTKKLKTSNLVGKKEVTLRCTLLERKNTSNVTFYLSFQCEICCKNPSQMQL